MKRERRRPGELTDMLSMIGIAVVALLIILLFKVKGGILGMVLGTIAVAALIYWLKEIKRIFREEKPYSLEEDG
jgi:predicted PurR-regulated permease PerM